MTLLTISLFIFLLLTLNINKKHLAFIKQKALQYVNNKKSNIHIKLKKDQDVVTQDIQENANNNLNIDANKTEHKEKKTIVNVAKDENTVDKNKTLKGTINNDLLEYKFPELHLLKEYPKNKISIDETELETNKKF